jgi:hypothetical protein
MSKKDRKENRRERLARERLESLTTQVSKDVSHSLRRHADAGGDVYEGASAAIIAAVAVSTIGRPCRDERCNETAGRLISEALLDVFADLTDLNWDGHGMPPAADFSPHDAMLNLVNGVASTAAVLNRGAKGAATQVLAEVLMVFIGTDMGVVPGRTHTSADDLAIIQRLRDRIATDVPRLVRSWCEQAFAKLSVAPVPFAEQVGNRHG